MVLQFIDEIEKYWCYVNSLNTTKGKPEHHRKRFSLVLVPVQDAIHMKDKDFTQHFKSMSKENFAVTERNFAYMLSNY